MMSNNLLIGLAVGTVFGMHIAGKNRQAVKKMQQAEETVKAKMCEFGSDICECLNPDNQDAMSDN